MPDEFLMETVVENLSTSELASLENHFFRLRLHLHHSPVRCLNYWCCYEKMGKKQKIITLKIISQSTKDSLPYLLWWFGDEAASGGREDDVSGDGESVRSFKCFPLLSSERNFKSFLKSLEWNACPFFIIKCCARRCESVCCWCRISAIRNDDLLFDIGYIFFNWFTWWWIVFIQKKKILNWKTRARLFAFLLSRTYQIKPKTDFNNRKYQENKWNQVDFVCDIQEHV